MTTELQIWNLALDKLGVKNLTSTEAESTSISAANKCRNNYSFCRDAVLESRAWTFATEKIEILDADATVHPFELGGQMGYDYQFADYGVLPFPLDPTLVTIINFTFNIAGTRGSLFWTDFLKVFADDGNLYSEGNEGSPVLIFENFNKDYDYNLQIRTSGAGTYIIALDGVDIHTGTYDDTIPVISEIRIGFFYRGFFIVNNFKIDTHGAARDVAFWPMDDGSGFSFVEKLGDVNGSIDPYNDSVNRGAWKQRNPRILRVYRLYREESCNPQDAIADWERRGNVIYTTDSYDRLWMKAIVRVVDPDRYSAGFVQALATYLAATICMALTENRQLRDDLWDEYENMKVDEAAAADGSQGRNEVVRSTQLTSIRSR